MSANIERLAARLAVVSEKAPVHRIDWPSTVPEDEWFMSPELISLYGTESWDGLDEAARKKLSLFEAVNFFSLNIYGEKPLISGLAQRIYTLGYGNVSQYIHHFVGEENRHMEYFGNFCLRYGGKIYPEKRFTIADELAPGEEDVLFFAQTVIFEMMSDYYNMAIAGDDRVCSIARLINRLHHDDETRHLVFGRKILAELWEVCSRNWDAPSRASVQKNVIAFIHTTWRQYYNPDAYRDAGIADPYGAMDRAWKSPNRVAFRATVEGDVRAALRQVGILDGDCGQ